MINHYNVLGIDKEASAEDVKKAYLKLTRRYHPDITGDTSGHFFKMIQEAYDVLRDDDKRKQYDSVEGKPSAQYAADEPNQESSAPNDPNSFHDVNEVKWDRVAWRSKDFSSIEEKIITPRPGLLPGAVTLFAFVLFHSLVAVSIIGIQPSHFMNFLALYGLGIVAVFFAAKSIIQHHAKDKYFIASAAQTAFAGWVVYQGMQANQNLMHSTVTFVGSLAAGILGYFAIKNLNRWDTFRNRRHHMTFTAAKIKEGRIWGVPGDLSDAIDKFGEENVEKGSLGEKKMALLLEELLEIPGTRIFHGLKFPGSKTADVDHAVINGNKIAFIDSKMWTGGDFSWGAYDVIVQNKGRWRTDRSSNFSAAVGKLNQLAPEKTDVIGYICIYSNDNTLVNVNNEGHETSLVHLATPEMTIREIGNWFLQNKELGTIDRNLMNFLLYQMK